MSERCLKYFLRGFFWFNAKDTYHGDFRCWLKGRGWLGNVLVVGFFAAILGVGFVAGIAYGRHLGLKDGFDKGFYQGFHHCDEGFTSPQFGCWGTYKNGLKQVPL